MLLQSNFRNMLLSLALAVCLTPFSICSANPLQTGDVDTATRVSEFGKYEGYSEPGYEKWVLTSQYVEMRDGIKLAVDVVRPSLDGETPAEDRFPVVWTHSRYHRNQSAMNPLAKSLVDGRPDLQRLVQHGYVVVSVGVRGSGASFGRFEGLFSPNETGDAYEIIEWISTQPWSNGNVGMFGESYLGMTQYMAASRNHPALKAIFPDVAGFDLYDVLYPGGVFRKDMISHWDQLTEMLDNELTAAKVATDMDGNLLQSAIAGHEDNWQVLKEYIKAPHRDTVSVEHSWSTHNPSAVLVAINEAGVPAYHWNGFLDIFVTDSVLWFSNYEGPQKMGIGPWPHSTMHDRRFLAERFQLKGVEQHRWFDYWLKGIDNGIMDEPPINYAALDTEDQWDWKTAHQWPPASSTSKAFYFAGGSSGSIDSVNDGLLQLDPPAEECPADEYAIDLTTTTGSSSRWDNAVGQGPLLYGDLSENDCKSLTYTTETLESDVTITGHPVVTLYVRSTIEDCDFYVLLEEVDTDRVSHYVTEGVLRASRRVESPAPWNNLGLPYQRCYESDFAPLPPEEIVELRMDLHAMSTVFNAGHRIRLSIMCADKDNTTPMESSADGTIYLHHDAEHQSRVELPVEQR